MLLLLKKRMKMVMLRKVLLIIIIIKLRKLNMMKMEIKQLKFGKEIIFILKRKKMKMENQLKLFIIKKLMK